MREIGGDEIGFPRAFEVERDESERAGGDRLGAGEGARLAVEREAGGPCRAVIVRDFPLDPAAAPAGAEVAEARQAPRTGCGIDHPQTAARIRKERDIADALVRGPGASGPFVCGDRDLRRAPVIALVAAP